MEDTNIILFSLHIAGAAALLIWSVRLVRTGIERAFSVQLRLWLRRSSKNRVLAVVTGAVSAMLLQSSTAVAVLVSNFVAGGSIATVVGLAILLGADVGSALVAQFLLVKQNFLVPLLLLVGVGLFLRGQQRRMRQTGRVLIGLALIFVSLDMIRAATAPLVENEDAALAMAYLSRDLLTAFLIGAGFAWVVHSSVAAVLLFVTLVAQGVLPPSAAAAMVLGANLGGSLIAYVLTLSAPIEARRMIASNLALRGGGAGLALLLIVVFDIPLVWLGETDAARVINLHLIFNAGLVLLVWPLIGPVIKLAEATMKLRPVGSVQGIGPPTALDTGTLATPDRALVCAAREIMHMGELVEAMLRSSITLFLKWDDTTAGSVTATEKQIREIHLETKLFLAKLNGNRLDEAVSHRTMELSTLAVNLEAAADMIARNLIGLARRLDRESVRFSNEGWKEIADFHDRVLANTQLAIHIMMTQNPAEARELIAEKEDIRHVEQDLQCRHLGRLRDGLAESIATSNIHQETLRALKQINTSFSIAAHPILNETGDLLESRLLKPAARADV